MESVLERHWRRGWIGSGSQRRIWSTDGRVVAVESRCSVGVLTNPAASQGPVGAPPWRWGAVELVSVVLQEMLESTVERRFVDLKVKMTAR